jgi:hypothetical protein
MWDAVVAAYRAPRRNPTVLHLCPTELPTAAVGVLDEPDDGTCLTQRWEMAWVLFQAIRRL